jgi:hypothetical protein
MKKVLFGADCRSDIKCVAANTSGFGSDKHVLGERDSYKPTIGSFPENIKGDF